MVENFPGKVREEEEEEDEEITNYQNYGLEMLLGEAGQDYLVRRNGDQVKAENVKGKMLGLYFSASWCRECQKFTPDFIQVYNELAQKAELEIIFVSADKNYDSFHKYFSQMPWLAIPFLESEKRKHLKKLFKAWEIPHLVILNENGKVVNDEGVEIIRYYGVEAYPFYRKRIKELEKLQEEAKKEQTLKSILISPGRDFVVSNDGKRVPISELEGKTVGLYFFLPLDYPCREFTPRLVEVYEALKKRGDSFETVMVCLDDDEEEEESFRKAFASMPWLALPFKYKTCQKLDRYFQNPPPRAVVIIGPDGKTLHQNAAYAISSLQKDSQSSRK